MRVRSRQLADVRRKAVHGNCFSFVSWSCSDFEKEQCSCSFDQAIATLLRSKNFLLLSSCLVFFPGSLDLFLRFESARLVSNYADDISSRRLCDGGAGTTLSFASEFLGMIWQVMKLNTV